MSLRLWIKARMFPGSNWVSRDKARLSAHFLRGTKAAPIRTLDCGCGNAYSTVAAWKRGSVCTGITIHEREKRACEEMRDYLGIPAAEMAFQVATLEEFAADAAQKGRFDQVLLLDVLEHIRDDAAALRSIRSLLAEDGFLYITTPDRDWPGGDHALRITRYEDGWHVRNGYTFEQLEALLVACGYEPLERLRFGRLGTRVVMALQLRVFGVHQDVLTVLLFPFLWLLALVLSPWRDTHTIGVIARGR